MRACIVYSSRTGNTRSVGEHLAGRFSLPLYSVENASPSGYDVLILGFWTWRGGPDVDMLAFMETLREKNVFFFGTMAAFPDSPHAERCALRVKNLLENKGCNILGHFFCQGRLDPQVLSRSTHPRTPERMARLNEAARHPDARDFNLAEACLRRALEQTLPGMVLPDFCLPKVC